MLLQKKDGHHQSTPRAPLKKLRICQICLIPYSDMLLHQQRILMLLSRCWFVFEYALLETFLDCDLGWPADLFFFTDEVMTLAKIADNELVQTKEKAKSCRPNVLIM